jgi:cation-transporting P-type ATPase 13A3/4/5
LTPTGTPFFIHDATRYLYNQASCAYVIPNDDVIGKTYADFHKQKSGLSDKKVSNFLSLFGINKIPFERRSVGNIAADEVFTYFYFYQFIMYIVWFWSSYLFVAAVEASVVVAGAVASIYIQYNNEKTLSVLTEYETTVKVKRNSIAASVTSHNLVPGDIVIIKETDWVLPCDMVLLEGSCVLNESGLTGESMPVQKTSCVDEEVFVYILLGVWYIIYIYSLNTSIQRSNIRYYY